MKWRTPHTIALLAAAGLWIALWYLVGAILYWLSQVIGG
jgi:hypothetical protein